MSSAKASEARATAEGAQSCLGMVSLHTKTSVGVTGAKRKWQIVYVGLPTSFHEQSRCYQITLSFMLSRSMQHIAGIIGI